MPKTLTVGRPWHVIAVFAVPLLLGNVVQQLYQVTDAFIVGRTLGVDALAAVGSTGSLLFLLLGFAWGLTSGFAIPTAQAFGAGDSAAVRRSVAAGTVLTAVGSLVLTLLAVLATGPALRVLQTPPELVGQASTFATVSFAGAVATMFFNYLSAIIRAIGDSRTPLVFLAVCCGLNVGLVVLLVRAAGLGVGGAALATVVSQALSVALCVAFIRRRVPALQPSREDWRLDRAAVAAQLRIGLPMGFQASIIAIGSLVVQLRLNELGADSVAAYTTAARVDGVAVAFLGSIGLAVSTFVAQNHGAGRPDRIRRGVSQAVAMSVGVAVLLGLVLVSAGSSIVSMFVGPDEQHVVDLAAQFLTVNGLLYSALGVLFVLRGALQGLGHALVPTITGVVELVMRVGAALVLGSAFGYAGVVWSNPLAWFGAMVLLIPAYLHARRSLGAPADVLVIEGPNDGSVVLDAVIPQPRAAREGTPAR
ncbi:MATE family efflux transporter [Cellulomonas edaphi]|uniref:MATE family efflux transporter n=1 Tax=Cellulomonas edaphi TaxID=3053468 RepID=A0ABT7SA77_9CELL|nr:MATE family efflux transporter [Cellulomons edaphi]MDM7832528.1 MATE family efflux transporter [Cellulomons edaphi]